MSIKSIKKMIWFCSTALSLGLCVTIFFTFFTTVDAQKVPELPAPPAKKTKNITLGQFKSVWETQVNTTAPVVSVVRNTYVAPVKQAPKLENILSSYLTIHSILNRKIAIIVEQRTRKVRHMNPFNQKKEDYLFDIGDETQRKWEVSLGGRKAIITKIDPTVGVFFTSEKDTGWLRIRQKNKAGKFINKLPPQRKLGENHWVVTRDEAKKMYDNYDQYIGELRLKPHDDGIWVRRVPKDSRASFYGLQKNDIVVDFNGTALKFDQFSSKRKIRALARKYKKTQAFYVNVIRNGKKVKLRFDRPK